MLVKEVKYTKLENIDRTQPSFDIIIGNEDKESSYKLYETVGPTFKGKTYVFFNKLDDKGVVLSSDYTKDVTFALLKEIIDGNIPFTE